jgi:hypothetical protein
MRSVSKHGPDVEKIAICSVCSRRQDSISVRARCSSIPRRATRKIAFSESSDVQDQSGNDQLPRLDAASRALQAAPPRLRGASSTTSRTTGRDRLAHLNAPPGSRRSSNDLRACSDDPFDRSLAGAVARFARRRAEAAPGCAASAGARLRTSSRKSEAGGPRTPPGLAAATARRTIRRSAVPLGTEAGTTSARFF